MKEKARLAKKQGDFLIYTVTITDKDGKVLKRISRPSRSYVEQRNQLLNVQASQTSKTIRRTDGIEQSCPVYSAAFNCTGGIGVIGYGIRIGKGTTAVAIDDYALETPCGEGTGVDEFNHQAVTFTEPSVAGSTCSFTIKRSIINNSGATIIGIRELGCYMALKAGTYGLGFRDVLGSGCDVPNGGAITVEYTIGVTV